MSIDVAAIELVQQLRHPVLTALAIVLNIVFSHYVVLTVTLFIYLFYRIRQFFVILVSSLATYTTVFMLKEIIARPRPEYIINEMVLDSSTNSFPSAHAAITFLLALMLTRYYPKYAIVFWSVAVLTSFSRIYAGAHYLTDVLAGAALGLVMGALFIYKQDFVLKIEASLRKRFIKA
jgi:undecaprenyl-diphosphatase